jgi:hypothetical protein
VSTLLIYQGLHILKALRWTTILTVYKILVLGGGVAI